MNRRGFFATLAGAFAATKARALKIGERIPLTPWYRKRALDVLQRSMAFRGMNWNAPIVPLSGRKIQWYRYPNTASIAPLPPTPEQIALEQKEVEFRRAMRAKGVMID